jgi:hypothetical protein
VATHTLALPVTRLFGQLFPVAREAKEGERALDLLAQRWRDPQNNLFRASFVFVSDAINVTA